MVDQLWPRNVQIATICAGQPQIKYRDGFKFVLRKLELEKKRLKTKPWRYNTQG